MIQRPLRFGALFAGYGGLEDGVQSVLGGVLAWYSEHEPPAEKNPHPSQAAARIMAYRHPGVPNLGDITQIDWHKVAPVDVLTGGSPCQDVSTAGKRAGMRAGTRSGLWASMCDAIEILRPQLVVWENVRGVLSSEADSAMEPCPGCVGDGDGGPILRALGRVLGDLAELGYDAWWCGLRASDVGAPHGRYRVFVFATPANTEGIGHERGRGTRPGRTGSENGGDAPADADSDAVRVESVALAGGGGAPESGRRGETPADADDGEPTAWGPYAPAIDRWAAALGRPAPPPTVLGPKGALRLSSRFVEWLNGPTRRARHRRSRNQPQRPVEGPRERGRARSSRRSNPKMAEPLRQRLTDPLRSAGRGRRGSPTPRRLGMLNIRHRKRPDTSHELPDRPCPCWAGPPRRQHHGHDGHCCTRPHAQCHTDVWEALDAESGVETYLQLSPTEQEDILAATAPANTPTAPPRPSPRATPPSPGRVALPCQEGNPAMFDVHEGLHVPLTTGPRCGDRNTRTDVICNRASGHEGRHAFIWQHLSPGRVREVWE